MPISFRFPFALVLSIVCLAMPSWVDFQAGLDAYTDGDYATALREFRPLAEQGVAEAQYSLGVLYDNGDGVPQDYGQSRHWWEKAATQGEAKVQYNLSVLYDSGDGVPQDLAQAHMWYNLGGASGDKEAATRRDALAIQMTHAQIDEAQKLAREWKPKTP